MHGAFSFHNCTILLVCMTHACLLPCLFLVFLLRKWLVSFLITHLIPLFIHWVLVFMRTTFNKFGPHCLVQRSLTNTCMVERHLFWLGVTIKHNFSVCLCTHPHTCAKVSARASWPVLFAGSLKKAQDNFFTASVHLKWVIMFTFPSPLLKMTLYHFPCDE